MNKEIAKIIHEKFKRGEISGLPEERMIPQCLETELAYLYFFEKNVYKVYKWGDDSSNIISGQLNDPIQRSIFLKKEYDWNHYFSKGAYHTFYGIKVEKEQVSFLNTNSEVSDFVLGMERLKEKDNLFNILLEGKLTDKEARQIGAEMALLIREFPFAIDAGQMNWYESVQTRVSFLEDFFDNISVDFISLQRKAEYFLYLKKFIKEHKKKFQEIDITQLVVSVDNHDENVFYKSGKIFVVDGIPPMKEWQIGTKHLNLYHLLVNFEVLGSPELAEELKTGYLEEFGLPEHSKEEDVFMRILVMMLNIAHHVLVTKKQGIAEKYKTMVDKYLGNA